MNNKISLSVIIPVYNEEHCIKQCLDAVWAQEYVNEVIVIDNNCTDNTVNIVKKHFKKTIILNEHRQGQQYAQALGFDRSTGDIIARIDADTILPSFWSNQLINILDKNQKFNAVTGYGYSRTGIKSRKFGRLWTIIYYAEAKAILGVSVLWGSNMAIKKDVWQKARRFYYMGDKKVHDDQSLSLALATNCEPILLASSLVVSVDSGSIMRLGKLWSYYKLQIITKKMYKNIPRYFKANILKRSLLFIITLPIVIGWFLFSLIYTLFSSKK